MVARNTYVKTSAGWEQIATTIQAVPQGLVPIVPTSVAGTGVSFTGDGQVTFTASGTVSLDGIFSAAYDKYLVLIEVTARSTNTSATLSLRAGGVTNASAVYDRTIIYTNSTTVSAASNTSATNWSFALTNQQRVSMALEFSSPFAAAPTTVNARWMEVVSGSALYTASGHGFHRNSTSFDGLSIVPATGTQTGTVRVYGYSKGSLTQPQTIQPYSMSAGTVAITGTGAQTATATVTFPVGRFSVAPIVITTATSASATYYTSTNSVTATGFTARLAIDSATFSTAQTVHWQATQMTSTTAGG